MRYRLHVLSLLVCLPLLLAACGFFEPDPPATPTRFAVRATRVIPTSESDAVPTLPPTEIPAPTSTPEPTPTPIHELMISQGRAREYPGSEVTFEQTLQPGANYTRYLTSYQSDGLKIYALLTIPNGEKPATGWPVIVFNHGYIPPAQYRTTERYIDYVDRIARSGYIVFRSDYRGHGSSEGEARGGYGSPDYTTDVLNAVATMKKFPEADPNRIGLWGHSMGGYITLRAMVIDPDIKAGSIWAGVVASYPDLLARWRRNSTGSAPNAPSGTSLRRGWRTELVENYGTPEENPEFWKGISANSYLAEVSAPIQLHHGTADTSVPVLFSQLLYDEVIAVDGNAELYISEGDNHNISQSFNTAMTRTIEFFDKYVAQK
jgi:dipeptidyl aminopeptidase/acylaminoacyl peptidase